VLGDGIFQARNVHVTLRSTTFPRMFAHVDPLPGRSAERGILDGWLTGALDGSATGHRHPLVVSIHGGRDREQRRRMGLDWLLRVGDRFPDGHLYVDLRGSTDAPVPPDTALSDLLAAYGADGIATGTHDVGELAAMWRSVVADRWIALMLHDAACWRQIRPLLTAAPRSVTVVTSPALLPGLTGHGARALHLDEEP